MRTRITPNTDTFYAVVSEGIDINKTGGSKECHSHSYPYWYFLDKGFNFQSSVCNGSHYVLMMFMNLGDILILNIRVLITAVLSTELAKVKP